MNDVLRGQTIGLGHLGLAGLAATQQPAFMHQVWPGGAMDRAIDAATAQQ